MVKVFTPNKNGKIEFTQKELEKLLDEVWRDGYNSNHTYTWHSPWWYYPTYTTTTASTNGTITTAHNDTVTYISPDDKNITPTVFATGTTIGECTKCTC